MVALAKQDNRITLPLDTVIQGDCLAVMRTLPDCSVDAVITDPPYGLGEVKDIAGLLTAWLHDEDDKPYTGKKGFMGKEWDYGVPGPRYWREVYRVLKPGAHILCFSGTRTVDLMMVALRLAGFECRDVIEWLYGSGFPKSLDVSKAIDKMQGAEREVIGPRVRLGDKQSYPTHGGSDIFRGNVSHETGNITAPTTPEAKRYSGYGTGLKPSHEPIILARKPLSESSIAANVLKWGTGGLAIDRCRVGLEGMEQHRTAGSGAIGTANGIYHSSKDPKNRKQMERAEQGLNPRYDPQGRFPSNLLLSHTIFCQQQGMKRVRGHASDYNWELSNNDNPTHVTKNIKSGLHYGDELIEDWLCVPECPIYQLDQQSGIRKSGGGVKAKAGHSIGLLQGEEAYHWRHDSEPCEPSEGGASRYFQSFSPDTDELDQIVPFKYSSKASRRERNAGCETLPYAPSGAYGEFAGDGRGRQTEHRPAQNSHPTVKPLQLCRWLCRLICPPDGIVLDPFCGSGSIPMAAVYEGCHFIAVEQSEEYCTIAEARIAYAQREAMV